MSRRRGSQLTPELVERLAQRDVRDRLGVVLPFVTLDAEGHPIRCCSPISRFGYFLLEVEEVLEDSAADWEAGMRITGAARYAPAPTLEEPWARATLDALAPRAGMRA